MAKTLLRSGSINDFLALGENGQTIFDSARQIRETLRLRQQQSLADCLAIPQTDDSGDKVDWYAPGAGKVVPWNAASESQRIQALDYLERAMQAAALLIQQCLEAEKPALQRVGMLLENIFRFPASQHIYLVDGRPVITFWGFSRQNAPREQDALACLRASLQPPPEEFTPPAEPAPPATIAPRSQPPQPAAQTPPAPCPFPPQPSSPSPNPRRRILLPGVALTLLAIGLSLAWYWLAPALAPQPPAATPVSPAPVARPVLPVLNDTLPLQPAQVSAPPPSPAQALPSAPPPVAKDALVLPAEAVKAGTTRFLNGAWRATVEFSDAIGGKPPVLRYQINNNNGTLRLTHGEGITCRSEIHAGLMQSGNLVIKPRARARCSDGSRFTVPEVICTQGLEGAARCSARYEGGTVVPVTFRKVGK